MTEQDPEDEAPEAEGGDAKQASSKKNQRPMRTEVLSKEYVQEALERTANPNLVLPLEHRLWTKDELELYIMSDGVVRPKWCSLPDETTLIDAEMSEQQLVEALQTAAEWLRNADALLVGSGAGMGVNSGLATFRGGQGGVWPAFQDLGISYEEICDTRWFTEDPRLGWGFWAFCHEAYRNAQPHKGYDIVRRWADQTIYGGFSFTSNIDAHWARSGWREDRLLECHGALRWLQCSVPCSEDIWGIPEDLQLTEDPRTHRAIGDLPVCPKCNAVARPCVLMFGGDAGFSRQGRRGQECCYNGWLERVKEHLWLAPDPPGPKVICLELGCGITVPTVRAELQRVMEDLPCARLIRVNPENPGFSKTLKGRAVSLPLDAIEALTRIDGHIQPEELARFILHDCFGNGSEVEVPRDWEFHQLFRKVVFENPWQNDENNQVVHMANNIYQRSKVKMLDWREAVPDELLGNVDGPEEPPAVCICGHGGNYHCRTPALEARFHKVYFLLVDLIETFKSESYQKKLEDVQDRVTLREMIRAVHLEVLPRHGYQVSADMTPAQWMSVQQRMQAFIQSGDWWSDLRQIADCSQEVSGGFKMHSLPPSLKQKAKAKAKP